MGRIHTIIVALICLPVFAVIASFLFLAYELKPPFNRTGEKLPKVLVETTDTLYCRMRYCDFRFPLPQGTQVTQTNIQDGGFDTVKGTICLVQTNGKPINLRAYAKLLEQKNFNLSITDLTGCDCCTNVSTTPFSSNGKVIQHPDFTSIGASSQEPLGGWVVASLAENNSAIINFSYFGDY